MFGLVSVSAVWLFGSCWLVAATIAASSEIAIMRLMDSCWRCRAYCWRRRGGNSRPWPDERDVCDCDRDAAHFARLRARVIGECRKIMSALPRIAGAGTFVSIFNCVLPNCAAPLIVQATLGFQCHPGCRRLGFLGLGAQPPTRMGRDAGRCAEFI